MRGLFFSRTRAFCTTHTGLPDSNMPKRILGWEQHKEMIHQLWIVENRPLHDVMRKMEKDHGFKARYDAPS
jgi:hypothetical protein